MKLYEIYINNGWEYGDEEHDKRLIVANGEDEAKIRAENLMRELYGKPTKYNEPYYRVEEIDEVDGFKIVVSR